MAGQDKKHWFSFFSRRTPLEGASLQGSAEVPVVKVSAAQGMQAPLSSPATVGIEWDVGHTILDDFVVERVLGEGGMGKVYLVGSRATGLRFAVKRMKRLKEEDYRNFLAELQTWIDLPDHPNLVPCRFFRTVADEVLIFAEYVEGGSLKHWIDSRRLYDGGERKALKRILDVAIQFAWGLHCVHELGLVHQDVKPSNVMVAGDAGVSIQGMKARVTDYGLARARVAAGDRGISGSGGSILISSGGCTPAYCSPEQARGLAVTRKTDIWSWGVSVLEMFTGGVTWGSGQVAAAVLEQYIQEASSDGEIPRMPSDLAEVLRGCFREDPGQRLESMGAVIERLRGVYQHESGVAYDRELAKSEPMATPQAGIGERRTPEGAAWYDPRPWLESGLRAEGRDPREAEQTEGIRVCREK